MKEAVFTIEDFKKAKKALRRYEPNWMGVCIGCGHYRDLRAGCLFSIDGILLGACCGECHKKEYKPQTPTRRTRTVSENEKRQKFEELAQKRVAKVCDDIRILGNLSNKASYDYTPAHVNQIFAAIQVQLDRTKSEFGDKKKAPGFAFVNIAEPAPAACPTTTVTAAPEPSAAPAAPTETSNPGLTIPA